MSHPAPSPPLPFKAPRSCGACGDPMPHTGKPGRPPKLCTECRENGAQPAAGEPRYDLRQLRARVSVNVAEACALTGLSEHSLRELWAAGLGPPRAKLVRRVLIPVAGLTDWAAAAAAAEEVAR